MKLHKERFSYGLRLLLVAVSLCLVTSLQAQTKKGAATTATKTAATTKKAAAKTTPKKETVSKQASTTTKTAAVTSKQKEATTKAATATTKKAAPTTVKKEVATKQQTVTSKKKETTTKPATATKQPATKATKTPATTTKKKEATTVPKKVETKKPTTTTKQAVTTTKKPAATTKQEQKAPKQESKTTKPAPAASKPAQPKKEAEPAPKQEEKPKKEKNDGEEDTPVAATGFASRKGRLIMPITGSYRITSHFGNYTPNGLQNVVLDNKGINIAGEAGSQARAVYSGTVSMVFDMSGLYNVILRHGSYITVYCNLQSVSVQQGQKVDEGQKLGMVALDATGHYTLHFQVCNETTKLNPELWLKRK